MTISLFVETKKTGKIRDFNVDKRKKNGQTNNLISKKEGELVTTCHSLSSSLFFWITFLVK